MRWRIVAEASRIANGEKMMQDKAPKSIERRAVLSGLGTAAVGGLAANLVGHTSYAYAAAGREASDAPTIFVFDVNETLLDIEYISPVFERVFNDR